MVRKVDSDEREHALRILRQLDQMKRNQHHCDFIVCVDGEEYGTHRSILAAGSNYFNAMLSHDTKESQMGKVEMMEIDSECVKVCIDYIYTGKAEIPDNKLENLIHAAHFMQLDTLVESILTLVENDLCVHSYYETKRIAEFYSLDNTLQKCRDFADRNFIPIISQPRFVKEPKKFVLDIIGSKTLSATEEEKLIVTLRWIRHEPDRAEHFTEFLRCIKLQAASISFRRHLLENETLIANNPELYQMFSRSIMDSMDVQSRNEEEFYGKKTMIIFDEDSDSLQYLNVHGNELKKFHNGAVNRFSSFSAVSLPPYIYVLLKYKSVYRLKIADQNANWEKMASTINDHGWYPPVVAHHGSLFVIGGHHECCTAAVEQYMPDLNQWNNLKNMQNAVGKATFVSLDEFIYSAGGFRNGRCLDTFAKFEPSESKWTALPSMAKAKCSCGAVASVNKIYIMGGCNGHTNFTDADCFDVLTSQWTSLNPMIETRNLFQAFYVDKMIYVVGGCVDGFRLIEKYDTEKNEWTKINLQGMSTPTILWAVMV